MSTVLTIGGATIDIVVPQGGARGDRKGEKRDVAEIGLGPGGGAVNAAIAFRRLGRSVTIHCAMGRDAEGRYLCERLGSEGIDISAVEWIDSHPTGRALIAIHDEGEVSVLAQRGANLEFRASNLTVPRNCDLVYVTSLPVAALPAVNAALAQAHPSLRVAINPGMGQIEAGGEMFMHLMRRADLLLCNEYEAKRIAELILGHGGDSSPHDLCKMLAGLGCSAVCVTAGPAGAWFQINGASFHQPPQPGPIVSSVGAGDAFGTTFSHYYFGGRPQAQAAALAAANAAAALSQAGANSGLLRADRDSPSDMR